MKQYRDTLVVRLRVAKRAKERRDRLRPLGLCVNENLSGTHGRATRGYRCDACYETHKRTR